MFAARAEERFPSGKSSFPCCTLMHELYKFREMIQFRDWYARHIGAELIVHQNREALEAGANPFTLGTQKCCGLLPETKSLLDALTE